MYLTKASVRKDSETYIYHGFEILVDGVEKADKWGTRTNSAYILNHDLPSIPVPVGSYVTCRFNFLSDAAGSEYYGFLTYYNDCPC